MTEYWVGAWAAILRVHATLVPALDAEMQAVQGLPLSWYDVLLELNAADRPMTMGELSEYVTVSRTRATRVVDELVRQGWAARERNPVDGRSSYVALTDAGRDRLRRAAPTYLDGIRRRFSAALTETEARHITTSLMKVLDHQVDLESPPVEGPPKTPARGLRPQDRPKPAKRSAAGRRNRG